MLGMQCKSIQLTMGFLGALGSLAFFSFFSLAGAFSFLAAFSLAGAFSFAAALGMVTCREQVDRREQASVSQQHSNPTAALTYRVVMEGNRILMLLTSAYCCLLLLPSAVLRLPVVGRKLCREHLLLTPANGQINVKKHADDAAERIAVQAYSLTPGTGAAR
jgi:hypothetical protein